MKYQGKIKIIENKILYFQLVISGMFKIFGEAQEMLDIFDRWRTWSIYSNFPNVGVASHIESLSLSIV